MTDFADRQRPLDAELQTEADALESSTEQFTSLAWVFVGLGFIGLVYMLIVGAGGTMGLSETVELVAGASALAGAFWALVALFFLSVSILGQRLDLLYNRQELRDTRSELRGQRLEFERQNETMGRQAFENTFFQLVKHFDDTVEAAVVVVNKKRRRS